MKVLVLLEFGIPPYRDFLFQFLHNQEWIEDFLVVHTGQKFQREKYSYPTKQVATFDAGVLSIHRGVLNLIDQYDVVISSFNIYRPLCWLPMLWKKNKRWILWGPGLGKNKYDRLNRFIRLPFINRSDKYIVYTEDAKRQLVEQWKVDSEKISVANNTLYVTNAGFTDSPRRYLLYVGRIQERKSLHHVVDSLYELKKNSGAEIPFVIVGDGVYKKNLQSYVEEKRLERSITFHPGTFDDETLKGYFQHALCYISPTCVGLGVVHAFSYGIPVMTSISKDHGREFSYCSQENSFLYSSHSQLTESIKFLVTHPKESLIRGFAGYRFYKNHLDYTHMNNVFFQALMENGPE